LQTYLNLKNTVATVRESGQKDTLPIKVARITEVEVKRIKQKLALNPRYTSELCQREKEHMERKEVDRQGNVKDAVNLEKTVNVKNIN